MKAHLCLLASLASVVSGATSALAQSRTRTAMSEQELVKIIEKGNVRDLNQVPGLLPKSFLSNFTIKHGLVHDEQGKLINGPRGHLTEPDVPGLGMHSEPLAPRAFVFDPYTGFAISYNGGKTADGASTQEGGNSLDTLSFDFVKKQFRLVKIDFPLANPGKAVTDSKNCTLCHGPDNRPIFSMYPDWPRFYGSDNDELRFGQPPRRTGDTNPDFRNADELTLRRRDIQLREFRFFHAFRDDVALKHPRYAPLYHTDAYGFHGFTEPNSVYAEYPYRSDVEQLGVELDPSDESRAFTRHAGLRFNLLYSRLHVQQVMKKMVDHPRFKKFGEFFAYNVMRCGPETGSSAVMKKWAPALQQTLSEVEAKKEISYQKWTPTEPDASKRLITTGYFKLPNGQLSLREKGTLLDYGQALALFGFKINDIDMRFTYHHEAYSPENAYRDLCKDLPTGQDCGDQVMQVGYLSGSYFNAYNDGSTTMDEHMTSNLLQEFAKTDSEMAKYLKKRGPLAIRGLLNKYSGSTFERRLRLDREFFTKMDSYSKWFSLPYPYKKQDKEDPKSFINLHHRAPFSANYRDSYVGACKLLEKNLTR